MSTVSKQPIVICQIDSAIERVSESTWCGWPCHKMKKYVSYKCLYTYENTTTILIMSDKYLKEVNV